MTTDSLDATRAAIREVGRKVNAAHARMADAVELRRRAAPIVAMYRAKRIAVYSAADIAALKAFAEYVEALDAQEAP